jgi:hypothetical protein
MLNENRPPYQTIYYDYNTPINPSIYTNNPVNNIFRNNDLSSFFNNFLNSTVAIRPTAEQLQNVSRNIRYGDIETPLSESCPISLERFEPDQVVMQLIPCGHLFCQSQFHEWFDNNVRCPVCRYDIRNYRPQNRSSNTNTNSSPNTSPNTSPNISSNSSPNTNLNAQPIIESTVPMDIPNSQNPESSFSNINVLRNSETNEIDQLGFDIANSEMANDLLTNITNRLFQSILYPSITNQNNDRFVMDPSNNILLFETIIRPNFMNNTNNNNQ